ncbi:hypothetical protein [Thermoproteus tenax]|uniref:Uncharacterized protein n=1 Tax=Thermoproteus tenax (strain ATCC 35583 / DSM 2078 / JCM 9277 / NBRC 100435 / Kra 1) TaxID=768679 RepID=G4RJF5_THETK|nr:hypothetical protein [Thermoproteus tenax]CCC81700.1 hypothetical protein TTX_1056 [Thermoproteus tenax Kra 1]
MEAGDGREGSGQRRGRKRKRNKGNAEEEKAHVLTHAVVVPSPRLSWRKFNTLKELVEKYRELVVHFVEFASAA